LFTFGINFPELLRAGSSDYVFAPAPKFNAWLARHEFLKQSAQLRFETLGRVWLRFALVVDHGLASNRADSGTSPDAILPN
jgi:hypothetical protein